MEVKDQNDTNLRVARLARAIWGQYGAAVLREWEERREMRRNDV